MNGYLAFFREKKIEVYADTIFDAEKKAIAEIERTLKPRGYKWKYDVHVYLCEKDGQQVTHVADR